MWALHSRSLSHALIGHDDLQAAAENIAEFVVDFFFACALKIPQNDGQPL